MKVEAAHSVLSAYLAGLESRLLDQFKNRASLAGDLDTFIFTSIKNSSISSRIQGPCLLCFASRFHVSVLESIGRYSHYSHAAPRRQGARKGPY